MVLYFAGSGLLQGIYWIRQGGDFMHGQVLLAPIFCMLAPVARRAPGSAGRHPWSPGGRLPAGGGHRRAGGDSRGVVAVGGELTRGWARDATGSPIQGSSTAPGSTPPGLPGTRAPADRGGLPGLPAHADPCWSR